MTLRAPLLAALVLGAAGCATELDGPAPIERQLAAFGLIGRLSPDCGSDTGIIFGGAWVYERADPEAASAVIRLRRLSSRELDLTLAPVSAGGPLAPQVVQRVEKTRDGFRFAWRGGEPVLWRRCEA